jgi:hypothetical protein
MGVQPSVQRPSCEVASGKEIGPDGRVSPNIIGLFLIWQQPHPIFYSELLWRARCDQETLERYREIVFETAEHYSALAL